jgi:hypothetical protein
MSVENDAVPFKEATAVTVIDSHTYEVDLQDDWCIGSGKTRYPVSRQAPRE